MKAGEFPIVEIDFVEAGVALGVKAKDDVAIRAAVREHGVKAKLEVAWELGGFGAGAATGFHH